MFTAVYLCYSPASQLWLAPFTRPQLQLELNKTSNRDTRPFCLSFSPRHLKMISRTAMGEKEKNKMLSVTLFFPFPPPIHSYFFSFFPHIYTSLYLSSSTPRRIRSSNVHLPTHQDLISLQGSHPRSISPPLSASVSVSAEKLCFLCHGSLLQSVSSRLWFRVWAWTTFG